MYVFDYQIPFDLRNNKFILSLYNQEQKGKPLSYSQISALEDIIEVESDFFLDDIIDDFRVNDDILMHYPEAQDNLNDIIAKYRRNRFTSMQGLNKCIRSIMSFVNNRPDYSTTNSVLAGLNLSRPSAKK